MTNHAAGIHNSINSLGEGVLDSLTQKVAATTVPVPVPVPLPPSLSLSLSLLLPLSLSLRACGRRQGMFLFQVRRKRQEKCQTWPEDQSMNRSCVFFCGQ